MDRAGDESCDLVEITRLKFMEAQGARDRPSAIQYLSVHCYISLLVLSSAVGGGNEGSRAWLSPNCHNILEFHVERWLPDFQWRPWGAACAAMRSSKKPWPRYSMTLIMMEPVLYGLRCSSRARSGGTTRAAARPGRFLRRRSPRARDQAHPPPQDR